MRTDAKIAAAVAGGYLLGRRHKAKLALGLGMWLTGRKLNIDPAGLARQLAESPLVGTVRDQVGGELGSAGRKALTGALNNRAEAWADSLGQRTAGLGSSAGRKLRSVTEDQDQEDDEAAAEGEQDEGQGEERAESRSRRGGGSSAPSRRSAPRKRSASSGSASGAAKRTASTATRKRGGS